MNARVHAADYFQNLVVMSLGAQMDIIVNAFFHKDSLNVCYQQELAIDAMERM